MSNALMTQVDLDIDFIQRNIKDLATTAQFSHMRELEELHQLAYTNLREQMAPGKPLSVDPKLVLEAYQTISGVVLNIVETKRKAAETMMKAHTLVRLPLGGDDDNDLLGEEALSPSEVAEASLSEGGVFGGLAKQSLVETSSDPVM